MGTQPTAAEGCFELEGKESLHHKSVVACAKAKLLGGHDAAAISINRIKEATTRELEHRNQGRETYSPAGEDSVGP